MLLTGKLPLVKDRVFSGGKKPGCGMAWMPDSLNRKSPIRKTYPEIGSVLLAHFLDGQQLVVKLVKVFYVRFAKPGAQWDGVHDGGSGRKCALVTSSYQLY
jgi:hypothetical protein